MRERFKLLAFHEEDAWKNSTELIGKIFSGIKDNMHYEKGTDGYSECEFEDPEAAKVRATTFYAIKARRVK